MKYFKVKIKNNYCTCTHTDYCEDGMRRDYTTRETIRASVSIQIMDCEIVRDLLKDAKDLSARVTALNSSIPGCNIKVELPGFIEYRLLDVETKETVLDSYEVAANDCDLEDGEYFVLPHGGIKGWYTEDYVPSIVHSAIRDKGGKAGIDVNVTIPKGELLFDEASEEARAIVEQYMSESGLTMDNRYTVIDFED